MSNIPLDNELSGIIADVSDGSAKRKFCAAAFWKRVNGSNDRDKRRKRERGNTKNEYIIVRRFAADHKQRKSDRKNDLRSMRAAAKARKTNRAYNDSQSDDSSDDDSKSVHDDDPDHNYLKQVRRTLKRDPQIDAMKLLHSNQGSSISASLRDKLQAYTLPPRERTQAAQFNVEAFRNASSGNPVVAHS
jgi:hypothetical protein